MNSMCSEDGTDYDSCHSCVQVFVLELTQHFDNAYIMFLSIIFFLCLILMLISYSVLFCPILFCSVLLCSVLFCSVYCMLHTSFKVLAHDNAQSI